MLTVPLEQHRVGHSEASSDTCGGWDRGGSTDSACFAQHQELASASLKNRHVGQDLPSAVQQRYELACSWLFFMLLEPAQKRVGSICKCLWRLNWTGCSVMISCNKGWLRSGRAPCGSCHLALAVKKKRCKSLVRSSWNPDQTRGWITGFQRWNEFRCSSPCRTPWGTQHPAAGSLNPDPHLQALLACSFTAEDLFRKDCTETALV